MQYRINLFKYFVPWKPIISSFIIFKGVFELYSHLRQFRLISKKQDVSKFGFDQSKIEQGKVYSIDKLKSSALGIAYETIIRLITINFNIYSKIWTFAGSFLSQMVPTTTSLYLSQTVLFMTISSFLLLIFVKLPINYVDNFFIEKKFGFFKATVVKWIGFELFMAIIQLIIDVSAIIVLLKAYQFFNYKIEVFKLSVILFLLVCFIIFIYPTLSSLFSNQKELPENELRNSIEEFTIKQNFKLKNIYIETSSTSSHLNASVEGNPFKGSIYIGDTLINSFSQQETLAVIAHELGHVKFYHKIKGTGLFLIEWVVLLSLGKLLYEKDSIYTNFGFKNKPIFIGFLIVSQILIPFDLVFKILKNKIAQNFEYQADIFAVDCCYDESLKKALIRLTDQNLSTTSNDWLYSYLYLTHPSKIDRLINIDKNGIK
ncbi:uncharacterized protein KGF55_000684 [Candida pseudojiufengensis]|uniref:uncharacterized protein n=1 Tax=Candida pseudojiufengensis TaxID=497109 RepID=UPI00222514EB|nr:uncharacterized protein KGF55_000684 [Candida pseudojiufengensis]KAI5966375.1 hypothetical protein KGF55_000684 [Candida pseudojiufengensis]